MIIIILFDVINRKYTYAARCCDHLLWLRFPAKTAQQRRPKRIPIVHENIVVGAFGAHTVECERNKLAVITRFNQPFTVRVLERKRTKKEVQLEINNKTKSISENKSKFIAELKLKIIHPFFFAMNIQQQRNLYKFVSFGREKGGFNRRHPNNRLVLIIKSNRPPLNPSLYSCLKTFRGFTSFSRLISEAHHNIQNHPPLSTDRFISVAYQFLRIYCSLTVSLTQSAVYHLIGRLIDPVLIFIYSSSKQ